MQINNSTFCLYKYWEWLIVAVFMANLFIKAETNKFLSLHLTC